jgi:hypothetical protein
MSNITSYDSQCTPIILKKNGRSIFCVVRFKRQAMSAAGLFPLWSVSEE